MNTASAPTTVYSGVTHGRAEPRPLPQADWNHLFMNLTWARDLDSAAIANIQSLARQQRTKAGFYVARRGSTAQNWTCVLEGQVRLHLTSSDGNQTALLHVNKGETFDEAALVSGSKRSYDAVAVRETVMLQIPAHLFHWMLANQPSFNQYIMKLQAARAEAFARTIENDRLYDTGRRVARCVASLLDQAQAQGRGTALRMPQRELGMLAGVSRQRTNAAIRRLISMNILRADAQGLSIVDTDALCSFSGAEVH